jgi:CRISPR-associated protein (TIGR02584 family)
VRPPRQVRSGPAARYRALEVIPGQLVAARSDCLYIPATDVVMKDVVLFAAVGPNPAPVSEAIWALYRHREQRVVEAHLVSLREGHHFLQFEFLDPGAILSQLQACLPGVLPHGGVHEIRVSTASDARVETDLDPPDAAAYRHTLWDAARTCLAAAGSRPVVFLLAGGRLRTTTAYMTTLFELLARPDDRLLDVRVDDRRVEGGTGFFFPEQPQRWITPRTVESELKRILSSLFPGDSGQAFLEARLEELAAIVPSPRPLDARRVGVHLVDVEVPRLQPLIPHEALSSFDRAIEVTKDVIEPLPQLVIDLDRGSVAVDGQKLPLPPSCFLWLTTLALHRLDSAADDGWLAVGNTERVRQLLGHVREAMWLDLPEDSAFAHVLGLGNATLSPVEKEGERLKKVRADTRAELRKWTRKHGRERLGKWLIPEMRKKAHEGAQRLPLPRSFIQVVVPKVR